MTDSPVPSSGSGSSDDFASYLDVVLDSGSDSPEPEALEDCEEDVEITRVKRLKVEASPSIVEGFREPKIVESSSKMICQHPGSISGLCYACGSKIEEESGVTFKYIHKGLRLNNDEIFRLRNSDIKNLVRDKKLYLVLDLDHTLLNSTHLRHLTPKEEYLRCQASSSLDVAEGSLFKLEYIQMMTKLRPFVRNFLTEARKMFELSIYTMGDRPYALAMAKLLDPKGDIFGDRIISRDDGNLAHKSLDIVLGVESAVLILDDSENAWPDCKDNLILMERYHFFRSSYHQFGFNCDSLSELVSDESESEGALATILKVLTRVHSLYFEEPAADSVGRDVRQVLKGVRKEILKDCKILFSHVFRMDFPAENHHLWKIAEQLGAECSKTIDSSVTHVVSTDVGTEKSRWAVKEKKFLVHPKWIEASNFMWRKVPEEDFSVDHS